MVRGLRQGIQRLHADLGIVVKQPHKLVSDDDVVGKRLLKGCPIRPAKDRQVVRQRGGHHHTMQATDLATARSTNRTPMRARLRNIRAFQHRRRTILKISKTQSSHNYLIRGLFVVCRAGRSGQRRLRARGRPNLVGWTRRLSARGVRSAEALSPFLWSRRGRGCPRPRWLILFRRSF